MVGSHYFYFFVGWGGDDHLYGSVGTRAGEGVAVIIIFVCIFFTGGRGGRS